MVYIYIYLYNTYKHGDCPGGWCVYDIVLTTLSQILDVFLKLKSHVIRGSIDVSGQPWP